LYEYQNNVAHLQADSEKAIQLEQEEHLTREQQLKKDKRALKLELKEFELSHEDIIKNLKQKHDQEITQMRSDFERQAKELHAKYEKKLKMIRDDLELKRKNEIHEKCTFRQKRGGGLGLPRTLLVQLSSEHVLEVHEVGQQRRRLETKALLQVPGRQVKWLKVAQHTGDALADMLGISMLDARDGFLVVIGAQKHGQGRAVIRFSFAESALL
jgi:hypothetical protein